MSRLEDFLTQNSKHFRTKKGKTLLDIVNIMDETLQLFKKEHLDTCNLKAYDFPKGNVMGCNCGKDAVEDTYSEIEVLLNEEYPEN